MTDRVSNSPDIAQRYRTVRAVDGYGRMHEEAIRAAYEAVLRPGDTAIDGGAHSGKHTIPMAAAVGPTGTVIAFEPSPVPFQQLRDALHQHRISHVNAISSAISNEERRAQPFLVFADRPGVSGFARRTDAAGDLPAEEIAVSTTTIDAFAAELGPTTFIKLDVEGAELNALLGGRAVVAAHLPVIHIEASYISWDAFGYGPRELLSYCEDFGYRVVDVIATPLDTIDAIDESFRTASVWDYVLIPPTDRGSTALAALARHAFDNYGL